MRYFFLIFSTGIGLAANASAQDFSKAMGQAFAIKAKVCLAKIFSGEQLFDADNGMYTPDLEKLNLGDACIKNVTVTVSGRTFLASYAGNGVRLTMNEKKEFFPGDQLPPVSETAASPASPPASAPAPASVPTQKN